MSPNTKCIHGCFIRYGFRKTKSGKRQTFLCKHCGKRFVKPEFKGIHSKPKTVIQALQLYAMGLSLREVREFLQQFRSHVTLWNWLQRYARILYRLVRKLAPKTVFQLHLDELFLRMQNKFFYLFDSIDAQSRYAVFLLEEQRYQQNAARLLEQSSRAEYIVSDGLLSYRQAIRKAYHYKWLRTRYYRLHTFKSKRNNNLIERLQGTLRRWLHPRRGFKTLTTANNTLRLYQAYYNFVREHSAIGMTPAEKAGVIKYAKHQNKLLCLIKHAYSLFLAYFTNRILNRTITYIK